MRRACVLLHLTVLVLAPIARAATNADDDIFRSDGGRACFRDLLRESAWGLSGPYERAAFIVHQGDGSIGCIGWRPMHSYLKESFYGRIPSGTLAIAHTHPADYPFPSWQDIQEASRLGMPIYVITIRGIYRADPGKDVVTAVVRNKRWLREPASSAGANAPLPLSAAGE